MAQTPKGVAGTERAAGNNDGATSDLAADVEQLKEDIAKLAKQLQETGQHSYGAARRVASEGVEQLRAQGEAAYERLRANAGDMERQLTEAVREKPVTALAIAAGIGFLFALMTRR
jgi:ElaB/YqjD/DUF883 family membrane-anchored ribosome-binding protein